MDAVSGIYSGAAPAVTAPAISSATTLAAPTESSGLTGTPPAGNITLAQLSSTSISASMESLIGTSVSSAGNKDLLGAVLLLLTLQYLQSQDPDEKKALLGAITSLAGQQQSGGDASSMIYSASSLSIESTQMQVVSIDSGGGGFLPGSEYSSAAPSGATAGVDVVA